MNVLGQRLLRDHQALHAALKQLAEDAEAPQVGQLVRTWASFEKQLYAHLEAEEQLLLPLLEASHPAEVARTRRQHEEIRKLVTELGVAVELHTVRRDDILRLVALLERHAEQENVGLYGLAGERASVAVEHRLAALIKARLASEAAPPLGDAARARP